MRRMAVLLSTAALWFSFLLLGTAGGASAHASVVEASPAPNSRAEAAPERVELEIDAKPLEGLFALRLVDAEGRELADDAVWDESASKISLPIPSLRDGAYQVDYRITSEDGHTVRGSYWFVVGDAALPAASPATRGDIAEPLVYAAKILYTLSLLLLVGWLFWGWAIPSQTRAFRSFHGSVSFGLQLAHAMGLLLMIGLQSAGFAPASEEAYRIPIGAGFGVGWLVSLAAAACGPFLLRRTAASDMAWIALALAAKSYSGHAAGAEAMLTAWALGWLHTAAAALWAGGLFFLLLCWKRHRLYAAELLPAFSRAALICMGVLWATGTAKTLLVADPGTIGASVWGALLLAKAALVAGATAIAATMRARLRRGAPGAPGVPGVPGKGWLTADVAAAAAIAAIAAAMALSSPY